jgi:hypothetical protein
VSSSGAVLGREQRRMIGARPAGRAWLVELAWTLPFLLLYWLDIAHHQLWFDELNAWAISAASPNLWTLSHYVHYEGHPWLWYYVLWLPSRLSASPVLMKWTEVWIGTAIYLVIAFRSPFTRVEKLLIYLSYFIVFEYTVMSRMYGIMLLLALLYVARRVEKPHGVIGLALLLGLMANTDLTGMVLSGALLLEYAYTAWKDERGDGQHVWADAGWRRQAAALLVYCALVGLSVYTLLPAKDISWQSNNGLFFEALRPAKLARCFVNVTAGPWWPINGEFPRRFWETDVRAQRGLELLAPLVLAAYWHCFRRERRAQLLMVLTLGFAIAVADIVYIGRVRHWGITVVSFLVCVWMMRAKLNRAAVEGRARLLPWSAYALLGMSVMAGLIAVFLSWAHPFSNSAKAAQWLREHQLANAALVGEPDVSFSSVAEQLQRPVYYLECGCVDRFKLFSADRGAYAIPELPDRLVLAAKNLHTDQLIFFRWRKLEPFEIEALRQRSFSVQQLAVIDGADSWLENYWIYRIARVGPEPEAKQAAAGQHPQS